MTLIQNEIIYPEQLYPEYQHSNKPDSGSSFADDPIEAALGPEDSYEIATVCGAINDRRTRTLQDTGASAQFRNPNALTDQGVWSGRNPDVYRRVKITLGWEVVYLQDVWIGNIGEGVDVLLGMNFMYSAGVRLCLREGLVKLPVEENVAMYDDVPRKRRAAVVKIEYGQTNPQREVVWTGREKRWVTEILFGYGHFPKERGYVRAGKTRYKEWQRLILEGTESRQGRMRAERLEQLMRLRDTPRCHAQSISGRPNSLCA
ncbi:hypothetical protein PHMEG_0009793 [Phytophthora megakarya]|uniref:Aspartic protease n=1 Tax=Phytophthora megakarya TaxID=4795 RepID=A0A225WFX7_9STRA|nr:hypothetical protein PHMEG_0009793 [Phytophthora megakarya]